MDPIISTVLTGVEANQAVNYIAIFGYVMLCFVLFFVIIALLTARDAYYRYENNYYWAIFWFLVVILVNLLGLIVYLLVRPDDSYGPQNANGGINIPMANFTGKDGEILMGIQLKVNNMELADHVRDMRLDIDWESDDKKKELSSDSIDKETEEVGQKINRLSKIYENLKSKIEELNSNDEDTDKKSDEAKVDLKAEESKSDSESNENKENKENSNENPNQNKDKNDHNRNKKKYKKNKKNR